MTVIIALLSIGILIILHELGHFFVAKKFGVKVEEFGIGLPPRIFGKKFGETLYSINLLPIGGFVRMEGEEKRSEDPRSFSQKPHWQRFLIVAAGVLVFWFISIVIFTIVGATSGIPTAIDDNDTNVMNPHIRIIGITKDSPAETAGLQFGDVLRSLGGYEISTIQDVREFSRQFAGQEIPAEIERGSELLTLEITPKENPEGEEYLGISLTRAGSVRYTWYEAPFRGIARTWDVTVGIISMTTQLITQLIMREPLPVGTQVSGPVGIVVLLTDIFALGMPWFLTFIATISIYLAIFNTIPIPALDGGRMAFILLEGIRKKPLSEKLEQRLIFISFLVLVPFIIWVTIHDIFRLF